MDDGSSKPGVTPESGSATSPPGVDDPELRSAFGLDSDEATWLGVLRRASEPVKLGKLGPYELIAEAGRGAQGTVYKAVHARTKRTVALKRMLLGDVASPMARARFEREIEAACALDDPGIVTVYSADVLDGHAVIAMEWVDGVSIDHWAAEGPRPQGVVLEVFAEVCDAVAHAHHRGVIHRDLKPSNVMVDPSGRARVLDFGLAKLMGDHPGGPPTITSASGFLGTPAYASPEQINGDTVETRSDVYALGVLLYELVAGQHPFEKRAAVAVLFDEVRRGVSRPPSALRAGVGRELDAIVLKAMQVDPEHRYQSAEALASDLRRCLSGQTVLAHPPSLMYRWGKMARRHRGVTAVAAISAVMILSALVVISGLAVRLSAKSGRLTVALASEHDALVEAQASRQAEVVARTQADRAADQSRRAGAKAEQESRRSRTALEYLKGLLEEAGGLRDGTPNLPVRDVLARAVAELDAGKLAGEPEAEMELRRTIAASYRSLGLFPQAETQSRRALTLAESLFGPESTKAATICDFLGRVIESGGRLAEAEAFARRALSIRQREGLPDVIGGYMGDLASVLDEQGRFAESEAVYRESLRIWRTALGPGSLRLAPVYRNIGLEQIERGRYADAEPSERRALTIFEQGGKANTDPWFRARRNLARIMAATGRVEQAITIMNEVIGAWSQQIGADHPQIARERTVLAPMLAQAGRTQESLALFESAIATLRQRMPAEHPWVVRARVSMVRVIRAYLGEEAAEDEARRVLSDSLRAAPGAEALVVDAAEQLAQCLAAQCRDQEAGEVLIGAAGWMAARLPLSDPRVVRCIGLVRTAGR